MNCKNCNITLSENSDYCNACGGKVIRNRLTFKNLFEHISETFFNYDNKLLRTIIDLFKKPEAVIVSYIEGVRKRYVNPISFFGVALTLSGLYVLVLNKFFPEVMDFSAITPKGQEEMQQRNMSFIQEYQSIVMMLYVPIYALIAKLTFIGLKKFNYTEMVVVFMYIQAQISVVSAAIVIIGAFFGITYGVMSLFLLPLMILYSAYCLQRIYRLSLKHLLLRGLLFIFILILFFIALSIGMFVIMYLNGDFQQMIETQKAAQGV